MHAPSRQNTRLPTHGKRAPESRTRFQIAEAENSRAGEGIFICVAATRHRAATGSMGHTRAKAYRQVWLVVVVVHVRQCAQRERGVSG